MSIPLTEQLKEVERELAIRRAVYPGLVERKRMKQGAADECMARLAAVAETLRQLMAGGKWD